MIMKNRKIVVITSTLLVLLFLSQLFVLKRSTSSNSNKRMTSLESCTLQNAILYNSFMFAMMNDGVKLERLQEITTEWNGKVIPININKPVLIIFVPLSDDICSSCVNYAINSVRDSFDDFSKNDRIFLLAQGRNPILKSRVYNKPIYHEIPDSYILNLITTPEKKPFYFVVDDNMEASMFFVPNSLMPELTEKYLKLVAKRYFNETVF